MKGKIIKVSAGTITEIARSDVQLVAENIIITAALQVNETGKDGIFFD